MLNVYASLAALAYAFAVGSPFIGGGITLIAILRAFRSVR